MKLVKLAFRNLLRHGRRTAITVLAIALGLGLMIWSNNLAQGMYREMVRSGVSTLAGDAVVQAEGYQEEREAGLLVRDASAVVTTLRGRFPEATVVSRTLLQGLVTSPRNSVGVAVTGIDPDVEPSVSTWHEKVVEGAFLEDRERGIVLGAALAESLEVGLGDKVVVMAQGEGEMTSRLYRVDGLIRTGSEEMDGFVALVPVATTAELLGVEDAVSQVSVHRSGADTRELAADVREALGDPEGLEVLSWPEALPELVQYIRLDRAGNHVIIGVIGVIVAMGVLNTVLMSVMERMRELGVLLALGVSPGQVARVVLTEALLLGAFAAAVGVALGSGATWPFLEAGIDFTQLGGGETMQVAGVATSMIAYPVLDWPSTFVYAAVAVGLTVLAAIYPALKAARLRPVDAMRHV